MRSTCCSVSRNKGTKDYQIQLWSEQQFDSSLHEMMLWRTPQRNASYSLVISISQMPAPAESRQCLPLRSTDILCLQLWPLLPSNTPWRRQSGIIVVIVYFTWRCTVCHRGKSGRERKQNLEAGTQAGTVEEGCFLAYSLRHAQLASSPAQGHLPRGVIAHSVLNPPTLVICQENVPTDLLKAYLYVHISFKLIFTLSKWL